MQQNQSAAWGAAGVCDKRPESVLVCRCELCVLACAHGVGSYKKTIDCMLFKTSRSLINGHLDKWVLRECRGCQMGGQCEQVLQLQWFGKKVPLCLLATEPDQGVLLESGLHTLSGQFQMQ
jgi:hypothetical protein